MNGQYPPPPPACPAYLTTADCAELQAVDAKPLDGDTTGWLILAMVLGVAAILLRI